MLDAFKDYRAGHLFSRPLRIIMPACFYVSFILLSVPSAGQDSLLRKRNSALNKVTRYGLTIDQDMFAETFGFSGKNEDRNYTMGVGLFLTNNRWAGAKLFQPFRCAAKKSYENREEDIEQLNATLNVGVTAFTPRYLRDNIDDSLYYIINDRPFSSLTFLSAKYQVLTKGSIETNQLVVGILGLGIAREAQTLIHKDHWFGSTRDIPTGWKYQLSNGGEPTILLSNRKDRLINDSSSFSAARENNINTQFIFSREYRIGYYTGVNAGIAMRIGILDPNNWSSYDTYQLGFVNGVVQEEQKLKCELYFQASLRPHIVLYNAHLMGQFKDNFHDLSFSQIKKVVVECFAGLGATIPNARKNYGVNIMAYISGRTPEFKTTLSNRAHIWGGIQVNFTRIKPVE
jgi:hypothetical protein